MRWSDVAVSAGTGIVGYALGAWRRWRRHGVIRIEFIDTPSGDQDEDR